MTATGVARRILDGVDSISEVFDPNKTNNAAGGMSRMLDHLHNLAPNTFPPPPTSGAISVGDGGYFGTQVGGQSPVVDAVTYLKSASLEMLSVHDHDIPVCLRDMYKQLLVSGDSDKCRAMSVVFNMMHHSRTRLLFYKDIAQLASGALTSRAPRFLPLDRGIRGLEVSIHDVFNDIAYHTQNTCGGDLFTANIKASRPENPYVRMLRNIILEGLREFAGNTNRRLFKEQTVYDETDRALLDVYMRQRNIIQQQNSLTSRQQIAIGDGGDNVNNFNVKVRTESAPSASWRDEGADSGDDSIRLVDNAVCVTSPRSDTVVLDVGVPGANAEEHVDGYDAEHVDKQNVSVDAIGIASVPQRRMRRDTEDEREDDGDELRQVRRRRKRRRRQSNNETTDVEISDSTIPVAAAAIDGKRKESPMAATALRVRVDNGGGGGDKRENTVATEQQQQPQETRRIEDVETRELAIFAERYRAALRGGTTQPSSDNGRGGSTSTSDNEDDIEFGGHGFGRRHNDDVYDAATIEKDSDDFAELGVGEEDF